MSLRAQVYGSLCGDTQHGQDCRELWHGWVDPRPIHVLQFPSETVGWRSWVTRHLKKRTWRDLEWLGRGKCSKTKCRQDAGVKNTHCRGCPGITDDLLCVGCRLGHGSYLAIYRHQVIMPIRHPLAGPIITHCHIEEGQMCSSSFASWWPRCSCVRWRDGEFSSLRRWSNLHLFRFVEIESCCMFTCLQSYRFTMK